jgi:hypothetical protein
MELGERKWMREVVLPWFSVPQRFNQSSISTWSWFMICFFCDDATKMVYHQSDNNSCTVLVGSFRDWRLGGRAQQSWWVNSREFAQRYQVRKIHPTVFLGSSRSFLCFFDTFSRRWKTLESSWTPSESSERHFLLQALPLVDDLLTCKAFGRPALQRPLRTINFVYVGFCSRMLRDSSFSIGLNTLNSELQVQD